MLKLTVPKDGLLSILTLGLTCIENSLLDLKRKMKTTLGRWRSLVVS